MALIIASLNEASSNKFISFLSTILYVSSALGMFKVSPYASNLSSNINRFVKPNSLTENKGSTLFVF